VLASPVLLASPESCTEPKEGAAMAADEGPLVHVLWINAGLSCDGDSVALTAAMQPSIEDIVLGTLPGLPRVAVHWPLIDFDNGPVGGSNDFIEWFFKAERGELEPFVLVVEGSIPNESIKKEGYWSASATIRRRGSR
jgi:hydrogenase small subunit